MDILDKIINKKTTVVGFCTGVLGLVAITPAAESTGIGAL